LKEAGFIFIFLVILSGGIFARNVPERRVAVIEQVTVSGSYTSNAERHLAARIETQLQGLGWTTLARGSKYDELIKEQNLSGIDPLTAPRRNKIWGSTALVKVYAEINISEDPHNSSFYFQGWGSSSSSTTYIARGVVNLQTIDSETGETKPNVLCEKIISQDISTGSSISTPYFNTSGYGSTGNVREILCLALLDALADEAAMKLNSMYYQVPEQENVALDPVADEPHNFCNQSNFSDVKISGATKESEAIIYANPNALLVISIGSNGERKEAQRVGSSGVVKLTNIKIGVPVKVELSQNNNIVKTRQKVTPCEIDMRMDYPIFETPQKMGGTENLLPEITSEPIIQKKPAPPEYDLIINSRKGSVFNLSIGSWKRTIKATGSDGTVKFKKIGSGKSVQVDLYQNGNIIKTKSGVTPCRIDL